MLQHLATLVWLRWRLTRNQWQRQGTASFVITLLVVIFGALLAVAGGVAGVYCGWDLLPECSALTIMLVWDGLTVCFLFFWISGLVTAIQKAEIIDLRHLLHLPISLREAFVLNYLSSLCAISVIFFLPGMLGLVFGYALAAGPLQLLLVLLVLGFIFMVTAWSYCLQSWLAAIMANPRRRRNVIMGTTVVIILLAQLPNLLMHARSEKAQASATPSKAAVVERGSLAEKCAGLERAHLYIPFLWLPQGARALSEGNAGVAGCGIMGMLALGFLGLARAYRTTVRAYRGEEKASAMVRVAEPVKTNTGGLLLVERTLLLIPDDVAAMALAFCTAFCWFSAAGNLTSIMIPFRISAGTMRAHKLKSSTALLVMLVGLLLMATGLLIFLPPALGLLCDRFHVFSSGLVTLIAAAIQAILTALLYWFTLAPLGRLLQQREQQILAVVTQEVE
ncbi:MAG: hypothetical protein WCR06_00285 [bacterium]